MRSILAFSCATLLLSTVASAQTFCLSTLFARNNGGGFGGAVYFDVNVLNPNGIKVTSLETNTFETVAFTVEVYTTPATSVGNQTNAALWTLVATGSATGMGGDVPTPIDVTDFGLAPGTHGIAIVMGPTAGHDYTNGDGSNQFHADSNLEISLGSASNAAFTGNIFDPRVWNGTICYEEQVECWLVAGINPTNIQLGGDTLLVQPLLMVWMTLTNLPVIDVPPAPGLIGTSVYVQGLLYNPAMFPADPLRLSQGLEFNIGTHTTPYGTGSGLSLWAIGSVVAQPGGRIEIDFSIN